MKGLEGKVGIVTGAGSGIGRACAIRLADAGVSVVVADINEAGADQTVQLIADGGGRAIAVPTDVADESAVAALVDAAVSRFGSLQLLHSNAADTRIVAEDNDLLGTDLKVWDRTFLVNLRGAVACCKSAIPHMLNAGSGSIVITSSAAGQQGELTHTAYGASKAALDSLARSIATQYGKRRIRCNSLAPGGVRTPSHAHLPAEWSTLIEQNHVTPTIGEPEEIAEVVAFLLSDSASFITGQRVNVDGGLTMHYPLYSSLIGGKL